MASAEAVVYAFTGLHSTKHPSVVMLVTRGGADKDKVRLLLMMTGEVNFHFRNRFRQAQAGQNYAVNALAFSQLVLSREKLRHQTELGSFNHDFWDLPFTVGGWA